jgi:hypothetical protein
MTALSIRNDTWIDPPPPKAENPPKQKTLERIAKQNRDPDGDILKLELLGKSYSEYRARLMSRNPFCVYCGQKLKEATATLDHIYPHSRGGLNAPGNLFLACGRCNVAKGDKSALEWLQSIYAACLTMGLIEEPDEPEPDEEPDPADWWKGDGSTTG